MIERQEIERCVAFLKKHGYTVTKKPEPVHILRCVCGAKRTGTWYMGRQIKRVCKKCGLEGEWANSDREAKISFNTAVEEAKRAIR